MLIVFVIIVVVVLVVVVRSWRQLRAGVRENPAGQASFKLDTTPDKPMGFGYKCMWIAIRADEPERVAEALGLEDIQPANWRTGLGSAYAYYKKVVFVTPSVEGWVLVVGTALPDCGDSERPDKCTPVLEELGRRYESVFFFGNHRVVGFYAWARVDKEKVSRAYAYLGEQGITLWDKGEKTKEERELDFNYFAYEPPEGAGEEYWERKDLRYPDEEDVIRMAEAWSINPLQFDNMNLAKSVGLVGRAPNSWR